MKADALVFGFHVIHADACDRMSFSEIDRLYGRAAAWVEATKRKAPK
jgi:hypothetical protein